MRFPDKHLAREKQLRRIEREVDRLRQAEGAAPIIPLERPYQRGWIKTYVLEERLEQRPDAAIFHEMLRVVNQRVYSRDRSFVDRTGQALVLRPYIIPPCEWLKLAWPASHQRFFSYGNWRIKDGHFRWPPQRVLKLGFKLFATWWLREDVQPHLITHQRVDLPDVKSRLAQIQSHMTRTGGWNRLQRLHGHRRWNYNYGTCAASERAAYALIEQLHSSDT